MFSERFILCFVSVFSVFCTKGLVTGSGGGGLQNVRGEQAKFYPYERGGGRKSFSNAEGGWHNKFWGSVYTVAICFSHYTEGGSTKCFHPLKGEA